MAEFQMTPFVKWAGGKSQLLDRLIKKIPVSFGRYYEPFVGGGAFFLALAPQKASINDCNQQLMNVYKELKMNIGEVISFLKKFDSYPCDKERYYTLRDNYNMRISTGQSKNAETAALMIWLNKHCFNGLYRVNKKGLFNVPWNNKINGSSFDEDNLRLIGEYLRKRKVSLSNMDFEKFCSRVRKGDFVYFDSPYLPVSDTAYFTDYTANGFSKEDHIRLAKLYDVLTERGVYVMLSNQDVPKVYELYGNKGYTIEQIDAKRLINRNAKKRTGKEVIITNY